MWVIYVVLSAIGLTFTASHGGSSNDIVFKRGTTDKNRNSAHTLEKDGDLEHNSTSVRNADELDTDPSSTYDSDSNTEKGDDVQQPLD